MSDSEKISTSEHDPINEPAVRILTFLLTYLATTLAIMYCDICVLGLGDKDIGPDHWYLYWILWASAYLPAMICALVVTRPSRMPTRSGSLLLYLFLLIILVAMELSILLDIGFAVLLFELPMFYVLFLNLRNSYLDRLAKKALENGKPQSAHESTGMK